MAGSETNEGKGLTIKTAKSR